MQQFLRESKRSPLGWPLSLTCLLQQPLYPRNEAYLKIAQVIKYVISMPMAKISHESITAATAITIDDLSDSVFCWGGMSPESLLGYLSNNYTNFLVEPDAHEFMHGYKTVGENDSKFDYCHPNIRLSCHNIHPEDKYWDGNSLEIFYGVQKTPFGTCLIGLSDLGICHLTFFDTEQQAKVQLSELFDNWPEAHFSESNAIVTAAIEKVFKPEAEPLSELTLVLKGTPFQCDVWQSLLQTSFGSLYSYQTIANCMGRKNSTRAVASAIAKNQIGFLIPCHRVIRNSGEINQYRWGVIRKHGLICYETFHGHNRPFLSDENAE